MADSDKSNSEDNEGVSLQNTKKDESVEPTDMKSAAEKGHDVDDQSAKPSTAPTNVSVTIPPKFVPTPFPYHHIVSVKIDSISDLGWGVGFLVDKSDIDIVKKHQQQPKQPKKQKQRNGNYGTDSKIDSKIVDNTESSEKDDEKDKDKCSDETFKEWSIRVPNVLVGEIVEAKIFKNFDTYSEGDFVRLVDNPSPDRVTPGCPLAGVCGGCQFQHVKIETQRKWKTASVRRGLEEQKIVGYTTFGDDILFPTMGTDETYNYRNKLTPHYDAPIRVGDGEQYELQAIGFQQMTSRRVVDVEECPIATPAINAAYKETRTTLFQQASEGLLNNKKRRKKHRRSRHKVDLGATLLFRQADDDETTGKPVVVTDHGQYMTTTVKGIKFRYLAGNFFQNNDYVVPLMVDGVINAALRPVDGIAEHDDDKGIRYLIDCYCGSGLFALCASGKVNLCVGIEVNERAAAEATDNAIRNKISNCQFVAASAEAIFTSPPALTIPGYESEKIQDFPRDQTCVVLDPPRKGCSEAFLKQLYEYSPQRIVYMSCGPSTQARDAKGIVEVGGYTITSVQPYDLFPQTKHVECLMVFEKKPKSGTQ